jgi:hypothetical protein
MKKRAIALMATLTLVFTTGIPALAATVYYNGSAVSWDYGRKMAVFSYSDVQSTIYDHSATANTTSSGWMEPGIKAHAQQYVGFSTATAYWNCK